MLEVAERVSFQVAALNPALNHLIKHSGHLIHVLSPVFFSLADLSRDSVPNRACILVAGTAGNRELGTTGPGSARVQLCFQVWGLRVASHSRQVAVAGSRPKRSQHAVFIVELDAKLVDLHVFLAK